MITFPEEDTLPLSGSIITDHFGLTVEQIEKLQDSNEDCHEHIGEEDVKETGTRN